ncbi:MAG: signal peptide peptidase SppA [Candidatus Woesearchaeota archaeon]|jgi:protease-4
MTIIKDKQEIPKTPNRFFIVIRIFAILFIISFIIGGCVSFFLIDDEEANFLDKNVAVIKMYSAISLSEDNSFLSQSESSQRILDYIQTASESENIKAIIFEINSPGGEVVASKEIVDAIKKTNKTTVAWIRSIGTSGAYWVASSTDYIISDDLSIVGSIGVYSSYLDFAGLLKDYNVTYNRLVAGKYKDMGTPLKPLTKEERDIEQKKLNLIHDYFIRDVAGNRNMAYSEVEKLATGEYYLGIEAKENGLVDELGNFDTVKTYLSTKLNITDIKLVEFSKPKTFFERLNEMSTHASYFAGRGIGDSIAIKSERAIPELK